MKTLTQARARFAALEGTALEAIEVSALSHLDTAGAYYLQRWAGDVPIRGASGQQKQLMKTVAALEVAVPEARRKLPPLQSGLVGIGRQAVEAQLEGRRILTFLGKTASILAESLLRPHRIRWGAVSQHIHAIGIEALPIVGLMAFLTSVVLAYQGVEQLRPYGGEQFTVNLIALSVLREMGVLITAIMVAGRTGSAFTAEIGVMKAREEVDALQVMGLEPFRLLVIPRLIAIMIALPLLTFFAALMGLAGGYFITQALMDITLTQYIERLHSAVSGNDLFVGMAKAPVFAFMIATVACMHGLRVTGSAESIGQETTASVVKSIFIVLMLDAFFSVMFERMGL